MRTLLYLGVAAVLLLPRIAMADEGPRPHRPNPETKFKHRDAKDDGDRDWADRPERGPRPWWMHDDRPSYDRPHERRWEGRPHGGPPGPMAHGMQHARGMFDRMDRDDDGQLSFREFAVGMAILRHGKPGDGPRGPMAGRPPMRRPGEGREAWGEGRGPWGPMAKGGPPGKGRPGKEIFQRMDKDSDGKISKAEASERLEKHFDKVDRDADGYVTKGEMKEAMAALAKRIQEKRGDKKKADEKK